MVLFTSLSEEHGGEVDPGSLLVLPKLRFERQGRRYLVTTMPNSGARDGASGPFSFVDVGLPTDTGQLFRVERRRAAQTADPGAGAERGLSAFDEAFQTRGRNAATAGLFVDAPVREKLLASRLPGLEARVEDDKVSVHMSGIASSRGELEELIDIATLLAREASS